MREGLILVEREITRAGSTFWRKQWVRPEEKEPGDREVVDPAIIKKFVEEREKRKKYEDKFRAKKKANGTAKKPVDPPPPPPPPVEPKPPPQPPVSEKLSGEEKHYAELAVLPRETAPRHSQYIKNPITTPEGRAEAARATREVIEKEFSLQDRAAAKDAASRLMERQYFSRTTSPGDIAAVKKILGHPAIVARINDIRRAMAAPGEEQPAVAREQKSSGTFDLATRQLTENTTQYGERYVTHHGSEKYGAEAGGTRVINVSVEPGSGGGIGTWYSSEHRINLDPVVAGGIVHAMLSDEPVSLDYQNFNRRADAFRTLIHEIGHAASNRDYKYESGKKAPHKAIEEASTEMLAQTTLHKFAHTLGIQTTGKSESTQLSASNAPEALKAGLMHIDKQTYETVRNGQKTTRPVFTQVKSTAYLTYTQRFSGIVALAADAKNSRELVDGLERWSLAVKHVRGTMRYNRLADAIVAHHIKDRSDPAFARARELVSGVLKHHMAEGQKSYAKTEVRLFGGGYYKGAEVKNCGNDLLDKKVQSAIKAARTGGAMKRRKQYI